MRSGPTQLSIEPAKSSDLVATRRCNTCCLSWPDEEDYLRCPECRRKTYRYQNKTPMPVEEAESRRSHALFDRYYELRESERRGPTPEDLGAADAQEFLDDFWDEVGGLTS